MEFPIDLSQYRALELDLNQSTLTPEQKQQLASNIRLVRDSIVFFTAYANTKGLGGHSGGPYDIVPELLIADGFMRGNNNVYPVYFDEAGHRVAIQYIMAVLNGHMKPEVLLHYREFKWGLYGHPERDDQRGIRFSSGRLGHLWSYVNGVAMAHPDQIVVLFGSDGSQQEGGDAEAARFAVANNLNIKVVIDDNDVTIAGHPSDYLPGFDVARTLQGHGLPVDVGDGEDLDALYQRLRNAFRQSGPMAVINKRKMAVNIPGIEGTPKGHDVIPVDSAIAYLKERNRDDLVTVLEQSSKAKSSDSFLGSTAEKTKNRDHFGRILCDIFKDMPDRREKVLVVDSDLEGSCGLHHVRKNFPEVYRLGGIMERNNYSVAAGFGAEGDRQGIFGTFTAFLEMVVSEITMARLNQANVLAHFSHAGVDDMADNTCHFGINAFFADNGLVEHDRTCLIFPADVHQMTSAVKAVFRDKGLRFIFSTRSATPAILDENGALLYGGSYTFQPGKDEIVREGTDGYIVTYGEMLYRCLDVVERLRGEGVRVGLVNKPTLNIPDEEMLAKVGRGAFVLLAETQNIKTGMGARYGTWLLERGYAPRYAHLGTQRDGQGGLNEQIPYQGMSREDLITKVKELMG